jgi:hypothetical protein
VALPLNNSSSLVFSIYWMKWATGKKCQTKNLKYNLHKASWEMSSTSLCLIYVVWTNKFAIEWNQTWLTRPRKKIGSLVPICWRIATATLNIQYFQFQYGINRRVSVRKVLLVSVWLCTYLPPYEQNCILEQMMDQNTSNTNPT